MPRGPGLKPNGQEIRRIRVGQGITAKKLAIQIGRHPESIYRVESGRMISDVFASQIARALGVTVKDIVIEDDEESSADALAS